MDIKTLNGNPIADTTARQTLTSKQDAITDLSTIRSGAAAGATALQSVPSTYRTAQQQDAIHDATKQDVISDLATIRSGAALGSTALQTHQDISGKVDKSSLFDAGIKSITWSVVRSEISVTTVEDPYKSQRPSGTSTRYWKEFDGCPYFKNRQLYRVTFNGTVYNNLTCRYGIIIEENKGSVHGTANDVGGTWNMIGNRKLYDSRYESTGEPFCIMYIEHSGMHDGGAYYYGYSVGKGVLFTESGQTVTVKIQRANVTQNDLPKSLLSNYGNGDVLYQMYGSSTYQRTSIGSGNIVGRGDIAIGYSNISNSNNMSIAIGECNESNGMLSYAEGYGCKSTGYYTHAQGITSTASNYACHAEGYSTNASAAGAHSQGYKTNASGQLSHAEGQQTNASGECSHTQGYLTKATGDNSHAEGQCTTASANQAHSGGNGSEASARCAFAHGNYVNANALSQFAVGYSNDPQADSVFQVGNGLNASGQPNNTGNVEPVTRQNAFRVTQSGVAIAQTGLQIGSTSITEAQLQALLALLS